MYFARRATNNSLQSIKMIKHTINAIDKLKNEGLIKDFSISIKHRSKNISDFDSLDSKKQYHIFSAGKPMIAAVIWKLYDEKILDFNDPVCKYWPEFKKNNKDKILIKHIMTHTSGISLTDSLRDHDYGDLNRIARWLENYTPESTPGKKISYHEVTFGWILGEIVQRITNKSFEEIFFEKVCIPLNLKKTYFKMKESKNEELPTNIFKHESCKISNIDKIFRALLINKIPLISGSCISNTQDLTRFYSAIINSKSWLSNKTKKLITKIHVKGIDYNNRLLFSRLGLGIRFSGNNINERSVSSASNGFGHGGLLSCIAWTEPKSNLSIAILNNLLLSHTLNVYRFNLLSHAIKEDLKRIFK
ncbi:MAG: hypothetical protein CL703_02380 [Chloroflexi bacterium]|nr:hypothetical protein [Chloroflexota bacterium]